MELSKRNAAKEGVNDKAGFVNADLFESDFSDATVITLFLLPDINIRLRPKILDMKPGTRVVSNSFTLGEWTADETFTAGNGCGSWCTAYLWIVPAKVEGNWQCRKENWRSNKLSKWFPGYAQVRQCLHAHHQREVERRSNQFHRRSEPICGPRKRQRHGGETLVPVKVGRRAAPENKGISGAAPARHWHMADRL